MKQEITWVSGENYHNIGILPSETCVSEIPADKIRHRMERAGLREVRTSRRQGYIKRWSGKCVVAHYNGRFGEGYSVFTPATDSSRYVWVTYYVR